MRKQETNKDHTWKASLMTDKLSEYVILLSYFSKTFKRNFVVKTKLV